MKALTVPIVAQHCLLMPSKEAGFSDLQVREVPRWQNQAQIPEGGADSALKSSSLH